MKIITGKMLFTQTSEPIAGYIVEGSETEFLGCTIRKRSFPVLSENFQPTGKRYKRWEIVQGNCSWFSASIYEAQQKALELRGKEIDS